MVAPSGTCEALQPALASGDLVLATEVRGDNGTVVLGAAPLVAAALRRAGLRIHEGPLAAFDHVVDGGVRADLAAAGALAVDTETEHSFGDVAPVPAPAVVVRAVGPGIRASRTLARAAPVLATWAEVAGRRHVILAGPRSFCAGVERAIDIVARALDRFGAPVYVRRQIVHNRHVVGGLERQGAIFVDELDEVPDGATVVFSAHGVSPAVRLEASGRSLRVVDATCPLVAKVHAESRRFARHGYEVVLIGHEGHDETQGTLGEVPGIHLVTTAEDVAALPLTGAEPLAYITQTTLAVDDTSDVVDALRSRFPHLVGPHSDDICFATQNRQAAVRAIAGDCDLILVVGSRNSSNSNRLVEVAEREGCRAELLDDESELDLHWLRGASTIGITAGASAPEQMVAGVIDALRTLGPVTVEEREIVTESLQFILPPEVR